MNADKLCDYLHETDTLYTIFNNGVHFRIAGAIRYVDIWPKSMRYHILESEFADTGRRGQLDPTFRKRQVAMFLNGG